MRLSNSGESRGVAPLGALVDIGKCWDLLGINREIGGYFGRLLA